MHQIILPPKYYLDHFQDLIRDIRIHHTDFLEASHLNFLQAFDGLSEDAKLLLVRMINRIGPIYDCRTFIYAEIENIESGWEELRTKNLVRSLNVQDLDTYLRWLKKDGLKEILAEAEVTFKKSASLEVLYQLTLTLKDKILEKWKAPTHLLQLNHQEELQFILFLYFGKRQNKLILPTLRDLGIKKTNKKASFSPKFKSKEEASSHFFYATLRESGREIALDEIDTWPRPQLLETKQMREDLLMNLARSSEDQETSLIILKRCEFHPASEKRARLLYQLGHLEECQQELERMMDAPYNDEELLFAEDFLQRKFHKKKMSLLTETLRQAEKVHIDESYFRHPEFGVIDHFKEMGHKGYFSENMLWTELFWIFFHEELESEAHSEFDYAPPELKEKTFYVNHQNKIEAKFNQTESLIPLIENFYEEPSLEQETLLEFVKVTELSKIFTILRYMAQDYYNRSTGFPDLFIIRDGQVLFYEIKAEGDSLKATQLIQMRQLEKAGFDVKVLQVFYRYNENQTYVVVDLETTGAVANYNRITEIGAVKIQGNQVIETFQTLINPGRSIPFSIQALTGITNDMVKDAPAFEEVAERFQEFVKDSIFVAHNVSFDYGFLQNEYNRLEMKFVRPYICTKAGMKKHYPGLESYGLKNLCALFEINLKNHHRALSDAQAAARLLGLINQRRKETTK